MRATAFPLVVLLAFATPAWADLIYVSPEGGGDGSRRDPTDLQTALDRARTIDGDVSIRLYVGTYDAAPATFTYGSEERYGKRIVLKGGYHAESLGSLDDPSLTVLDGGGEGRVISVRSDVPDTFFTFALENLTVRNGAAGDYRLPDDIGAGVRAWNENGGLLRLELYDCVLEKNEATGTGRGGALGANCNLWVTGCRFTSNHASSGGAVYTVHGPGWTSSLAPQLGGCAFEDNDNLESDGGEGSTLYGDLSPGIRGCTFRGASDGGSSGPGSPVHLEGGGSAKLVACLFSGFETDFSGSAVRFSDSGGEVTNCVFLDNKAGGDGSSEGYGAIAVAFDGQAVQIPLTITNCTFRGNRSRYPVLSYGGAIDTRNHATDVHNCIFWDNGLVPIHRGVIGKLPRVGHSLVDEGLAGSGFADGGENILTATESPFAGPDDLHLEADSVCVDAGDDSAPGVENYDYEGNGRPFDGDGDGTAAVDIGAYESAPNIVVEPWIVLGLGAVELGDASAPGIVTVRNEGTLDLEVGQARIEWGDVSDFRLQDDGVSNTTIPPGESRTLAVVFTPSAPGSRAADISIPSNDPDSSRPYLALDSEGVSPAISPREGTIGTELALEGPGFGEREGRVFVEYADAGGKTRPKALRVLEWADDAVRVLFRARVPPGDYPVRVVPRGEGESPRDLGDLTVKAPEVGVLGAAGGAPKEEIELTGRFFGDARAKPKLWLEYVDRRGRDRRKRCRIAKHGLEWDPVTGTSRLRFLVPRLGPLTATLVIENRVGAATVTDTFEIRGS